MNVGFVGLGAMGQVIVPRLLAAGHRVTGWNRSRERAEPLLKLGMRSAESPAEVAKASEVTFSIVTDGTAVKTVALAENGVLAGMQRGSVYIDMGTIAPDVTREVATAFAARGFASGDKAAFERVEPVLRAIGPKVTYIGASGQAVTMKLAVNLLLMVEVIAFGEAVALAEKGGVARDIALDAVLKSVTAAPVLGYRGPFILEGKMPKVPLADVTLQQKDMLLVLEMARKFGSPVPLAAAANEMMNACRGLGLDRNDFVVAHEVYRRLGGQSR
jgi:3-hydroxyisobutyrate dehydrogenase-like beta-hydroxyacid dehydrogenase